MGALAAAGVRLKVIGDVAGFPAELQTRIHAAEAATQHNQAITLCVAANYGGQWDILNAARAWQMAHPEKTLQDMDDQALAAHLSTAGLPDPELLIRTGGESRISNFLLWQTAYTELYFTDLHWPDFNAAALQQAIASYGKRVRRFGQTDEQVLSHNTTENNPVAQPTFKIS
jgi:undecaprenyl diphosphate synthase